MSLNGRETASIAVKSPHVSLCRRGKARCKGLGDAVCKIRSPGDMRSSFTFEAQISGQTDGRPRVGAKKASNEVVKFWPTRVLAYAGSCKHCLPFFISLGSFAAHQSPTTCPIPTRACVRVCGCACVGARKKASPPVIFLFVCLFFFLHQLSHRSPTSRPRRVAHFFFP